jgi:Prp8 binding protein
MSAAKRPASDAFGSSQMVVKRPNLGNSGTSVALAEGSRNGTLIQSVLRTSGLQAPVMELTGHTGEVFAARFNPEGNYIASGSMDRSICKFLIVSESVHTNSYQ